MRIHSSLVIILLTGVGVTWYIIQLNKFEPENVRAARIVHGKVWHAEKGEEREKGRRQHEKVGSTGTSEQFTAVRMDNISSTLSACSSVNWLLSAFGASGAESDDEPPGIGMEGSEGSDGNEAAAVCTSVRSGRACAQTTVERLAGAERCDGEKTGVMNAMTAGATLMFDGASDAQFLRGDQVARISGFKPLACDCRDTSRWHWLAKRQRVNEPPKTTAAAAVGGGARTATGLGVQRALHRRPQTHAKRAGPGASAMGGLGSGAPCHAESAQRGNGMRRLERDATGEAPRHSCSAERVAGDNHAVTRLTIRVRRCVTRPSVPRRARQRGERRARWRARNGLFCASADTCASRGVTVMCRNAQTGPAARCARTKRAAHDLAPHHLATR
ncbi:hypothetical protein FGB62_1g014 [Gracilaria domingensis]|nr:hypothetical protein FGB62_1g014 [Gracilaria domingensis]